MCVRMCVCVCTQVPDDVWSRFWLALSLPARIEEAVADFTANMSKYEVMFLERLRQDRDAFAKEISEFAKLVQVRRMHHVCTCFVSSLHALSSPSSYRCAHTPYEHTKRHMQY